MVGLGDIVFQFLVWYLDMYQSETEVFLFLTFLACLPSDIYSTIVPLYSTSHHINSKGMRECNGGKKGKEQTRPAATLQYVSVRYIVPSNV